WAAALTSANGAFPGADKIAERLKRTLPPELQDAPDGSPPLPPAAPGKMKNDAQTIEQLTQALQQAQQDLQAATVAVASNERIQFAKMQAENEQPAMRPQVILVSAEMKAKASEDIALLRAQLSFAQAQIARMASGG